MAIAADATAPILIEDRAGLEAHLDRYLTGIGAPQAGARRIELDHWLQSGPDAGETQYRMAQRLGLPLVRLDQIEASDEAIQVFASATVRSLRAVPLLLKRGAVAVALENPGDAETLSKLEFISKQRVVPVIATAGAIHAAIGQLYDQVQDRAIARQLGLDPNARADDLDAREGERLAEEKPVVKLVADMIAEAVRRRASDIHIRPGEHFADLLYRIDDELVPVRRFLRALLPAIASRVKVLARMNVAEHRKPQDGRATFRLDDGKAVDMRISIMPAIHGESVVIRLLDTAESLRRMDQIGLSDVDEQRLTDVMNRSHGIFLVTGPTGCGKSTTLYAMLLELRKQRINILTIEDPVEYHIGDIQQMQVNRPADFTFANAMRNFLRHDPDVIMVGEIRDRETAGIAIESALTGHLVLSTLHTNTAATAVTRLLDLGVEPFLLRASLLAVMAQRLVRRICTHCKETATPEAHIREVMGADPGEVFYHGRGCAHCEGLGVRGRVAVYELLVVTQAIVHEIVPGAAADRIHELALQQGMTPLTKAALKLARDGVISLEEAYRVRTE